MTTVIARTLTVLLLLAAALTGSDPSARDVVLGDRRIAGPYASLLGASTDLGPARDPKIEFTVGLTAPSRPAELIDWARERTLSVRWRPGDDWAVIEGTPDAVGQAFDVSVHNYRGRKGQYFYASPQQPAVPGHLRGEVAETGRILSYLPHRMSRPDNFPLDVPDRGLGPDALLNTYNAGELAKAGFTGKGTTIVIFAFDSFRQSDLDAFTAMNGLPPLIPEIVGGLPGEARAESSMDLQVAHALAPDARKVVVNARPTVEGDGGYRRIGEMLEDTDRRFPGAVWSFSIGWGCDRLITAADLAPVRSALRTAQSHGTTAYNASGDLAGMECRGGQDWSSPPSEQDIGLDSIASLPEMTSVGGTTLSTAADGTWVSEQTWFDVPLSQGTGGGVSALFDMPPWQQVASAAVPPERHAGKRMTPDVAAVADPFTGVKIVINDQVVVGGGTSQSAPIWAGLTAVMNQYLLEHGGSLIGDINPLLYRIAEGAPRPSYRDVTLGGNAVDHAGPGYDLVTGLGTPDVDNLVRNLLLAQKVNA
ncbi:S53 family peptidase [Mycolicibacterium parafortuitum]|uniref:Kumamolisin n=1 Tax=Mycolicibacterium parafortuitum TaxID=39692 RepID=A0A375YDC1_MYCPF|nr:S53 family peptidase [Mycolicibacterium parafortuitum]ORB31082.1 peptidase S53 [Mycolicibacterium parafortuitum]PQD99419.1 peptidase S53 [Mycobacterium sp. EPG1]BBY74587.1 kumamolisin [Mycolicibacterium parafortuitum]SRX79116.1 putative peptidase M53 family protein [Kitasatospora setae KM-6054] [Mycolicibacterium parafortuitum]